MDTKNKHSSKSKSKKYEADGDKDIEKTDKYRKEKTKVQNTLREYDGDEVLEDYESDEESEEENEDETDQMKMRLEDRRLRRERLWEERERKRKACRWQMYSVYLQCEF